MYYIIELKSMNIRGGGEQNNGNILLNTGSKPLQDIPRSNPATSDRTKSAWKRKRVRPRANSGLNYTSGHISRIFNPEDAVARVMRSKVALRVEDVDDDSDNIQGEEELSEDASQRALSIASTGSNIVVYRPPSDSGDEVPRKTPDSSTTQKKVPGRQHDLPRIKQKPLSDITVTSRETVDLDRLQETEDTLEIPQEIYTTLSGEAQRSMDSTPLPNELKTAGQTRDRLETPDDTHDSMQTSVPSASPFNDIPATIASPDWSFATSSGTGLFLSDRKRPKRSAVSIAEGTILGNNASRINFPTPPPAAEEALLASTMYFNNDSHVSRKTKTKGKIVPSLELGEALPGNGKVRKRSKGTVEVSDLVSSRRAGPSRATMKKGVGLLVGTTGAEDAVKPKPLSWQAEGGEKGVTRAVPLSKRAKKSVLDDIM